VSVFGRTLSQGRIVHECMGVIETQLIIIFLCIHELEPVRTLFPIHDFFGRIDMETSLYLYFSIYAFLRRVPRILAMLKSNPPKALKNYMKMKLADPLANRNIKPH